MRGAMPPLPHSSSWRGNMLSMGTTLPFREMNIVCSCSCYVGELQINIRKKGKVVHVLN
jgi:hypothetical protein